MRKAKHPAYDEVSDIPEVRSESVPQYRQAYLRLVGKDTTLDDDDIVNIIASDEDGPNDDAWYVAQMQEVEAIEPAAAE